ncbi:hypothetical protein EXIGLDRAFT_150973 [Exidia glandulosa HHB12029]|uniref:Uncharacterized protein n=1 Tax=Exidia glandulosa HHB12029 TaxID=1314781 RepID=A0A165FKV5_EXIGL|nr:hypothetical protein EXIGLDRAFT_150973 [Exidia glandulosa HHB12029]
MDIAAMLNPGSDDNAAPGSSPHSPATQAWLDKNQPLTLADKELMDQIDYALQSDEEWQEFRANTNDDNNSDSSVEFLPVPPVKQAVSKAKASKQGKKSAKAKSPPADDPDDSSEAGNFKAYLEIFTPAYKKPAVQTGGRKKKAESVKASSARSQLLTLPRDGLDAHTLRDKLAQTVGIDGDRFALTNLTWRFFTAARATSQPLGSPDSFNNFLEYLNRKKNLTKEVLFVYERKIQENGTPKSKEYVPPGFPKAKPSKKKPADDDNDDDPFYVRRHSDSDDSVVQAELNDQEVEAACKKVDDQVARNKDQILAKHKIGNCLDHPRLHCARDEHGNHYDMAHEPRLSAYASSIPETASVDKLPDTTWFTAEHAIKRAVPAAAPPPLIPTAGQPDLTQLASVMNFGILGLVSNLLCQGTQAQLAAGASTTPQAPTPAPAPAPVTPAPARLRTPEPTPSVAAAPPSSPIPELCRSMTLDEYCELAEFSAETKEKLAALDHTPAQKVCKKRPAEWRKHFTVAAYAKVDEQDRMARTKIRRIDSAQ